MKRFLFITLGIFLFQTVHAQWFWNHPSLGVGLLNDVAVVDDNNWWSVGDYGQVYHSVDGGAQWIQRYIGTDVDHKSIYFVDDNKGWIAGGSGKVFSTSDGGQTWTEVYVGYEIQLFCITFLDQMNGWVTGENGIIFQSSDGGENWEIQLIPDPAYTLYSIFFLDLQNGWSCGEHGTVFHTSDGGLNWELQASGGLDQFYRSVFFVSEQIGWMTGRIVFSPPRSGILKTTNGGQNWIVTDTIDVYFSMYSVFFKDEMNGYAVGDKGHFYKTVDGGENWNYLELDGEFDAKAISSFGDRIVVAGGRGYSGQHGCDIFYSQDNGSTWEQVMESVVDSDIRKVEAIDSLHVWLWNSQIDGSLYKTTDGGLLWDPNLSNYPYTLGNLSFISVEQGWVIGSSYALPDKVYRTIDGGESWDTLTTLDDGIQAYNLQFVSSETGWFINPGWFSEAVYRSIDGGLNWDICLEQEIWSFNTLYFLDEQIGWVGATIEGGDGVLFKTINGGATWTSDTIADKGIRSVFFIDEIHGWCVTEDLVHYSVDGGLSWSESIVPDGVGLTQIQFIDSVTGWVYDNNYLNESSSAFKSTDGGITWQKDYTGASQYFYDMDFDAQGNGWIVGSYGQILAMDVADITTGVKQDQQKYACNELNVYPNPFTNEISFEVPASSSDRGLLCIYNLHGHLVYTSELHGSNGKHGVIRWFPDQLKNGLYIVRYTAEGLIFTKKIMKAK